jgi:hypothetical protein
MRDRCGLCAYYDSFGLIILPVSVQDLSRRRDKSHDFTELFSSALAEQEVNTVT